MGKKPFYEGLVKLKEDLNDFKYQTLEVGKQYYAIRENNRIAKVLLTDKIDNSLHDVRCYDIEKKETFLDYAPNLFFTKYEVIDYISGFYKRKIQQNYDKIAELTIENKKLYDLLKDVQNGKI